MSTIGATPTRVSDLAILSLVVAVILPPAGIPLAVVALRRIARTGERGRLPALVALWIGIVLTVIYLLAFAAVVFFVGWSSSFLGRMPGMPW
jgi:hypothetical protein